MKTNHKKKMMAIAGIILTPITIVFFIDRQIMVFLPHLTSHSIRSWFDDIPKMVQTMFRVGACAIIYGIYILIKWMI